MLFKLKGTQSTCITLKLYIYGGTSNKLVKASLHYHRPKCQKYRMKMLINGALQPSVLPLMLMQQSEAQLVVVSEYFKMTVLLNTNPRVCIYGSFSYYLLQKCTREIQQLFAAHFIEVFIGSLIIFILLSR